MADDVSIDRTLGGGESRRRRRRSGGGAATGEKWTLAPGDTLGGYRVVKPLGRGGMGEVYLAENALTRKPYALKLLPSKLAGDRDFRARFAREAAVLQELRHEGIVQVLHAAEESGRFFLTMDYVDGGSLEDRLRGGGGDTLRADTQGEAQPSVSPVEDQPAGDTRKVSTPGRLSEAETAKIAIELCDALAYTHSKGVIHRDMKPANVLLDNSGRARLSDFGLARVVGDQFLKSMTERSISLSMARTARPGSPQSDGELSQSDNAVIGTYQYMAPEQQAGALADERSDIFSLGLMVYRMLTGERAEGIPELPSELGCSDNWDDIVRRALATKPEKRYASVAELGADIREAAEGGAAAQGTRQQQKGYRRGGAGTQRHLATGLSVDTRKVLPPTGLVALVAVLGLAFVVAITFAVAKLFGGSRPQTGGERPGLIPATSSALPPALTVDCGGGVEMEFAYIEPGRFMMVSPTPETRTGDEETEEQVTITKGFYLGKYEVTQTQYQAVTAMNPSYFKGADRPVERVSWNDAREFCNRLSQRVGKQARLPTETEWEYACRAGSIMRFYFGDSDGSLGEYAWYSGNSGGQTHAVGGKRPNAWGLYAMHGNVWEWCQPIPDPKDRRIARATLRGGSWDVDSQLCRCASRVSSSVKARSGSFGFRVLVEEER